VHSLGCYKQPRPLCLLALVGVDLSRSLCFDALHGEAIGGCGASLGVSFIVSSLRRAEFPLKNLALDSGVSETLAEVILRTVSSTVTTIADDGDNHLLVGSVISKTSFEAFGQGVEITVLVYLTLKHFGLYLSECNVASINTVVSLLAASRALSREEAIAGVGHQVVNFLPGKSVTGTGHRLASAD